jgi:hypothetical protein
MRGKLLPSEVAASRTPTLQAVREDEHRTCPTLEDIDCRQTYQLQPINSAHMSHSMVVEEVIVPRRRLPSDDSLGTAQWQHWGNRLIALDGSPFERSFR